MTGLPRSIIKKYGVSKKAWSVFRSGRSRSSRAPSRAAGVKMAKRRRSIATYARRFGRRARRAVGRRSLPSGQELLAFGGWGALRPYAGQALAPLMSYIPAGGYSDNVGFAAAAYVAGKFLPGMQPYTRAIILSETFLAGAKLSRSVCGMTTTGSGSNAATNGWV